MTIARVLFGKPFEFPNGLVAPSLLEEKLSVYRFIAILIGGGQALERLLRFLLLAESALQIADMQQGRPAFRIDGKGALKFRFRFAGFLFGEVKLSQGHARICRFRSSLAGLQQNFLRASCIVLPEFRLSQQDGGT